MPRNEKGNEAVEQAGCLEKHETRVSKKELRVEEAGCIEKH